MCHFVRRDSSAIKFDRVEIAFMKSHSSPWVHVAHCGIWHQELIYMFVFQICSQAGIMEDWKTANVSGADREPQRHHGWLNAACAQFSVMHSSRCCHHRLRIILIPWITHTWTASAENLCGCHHGTRIIYPQLNRICWKSMQRSSWNEDYTILSVTRIWSGSAENLCSSHHGTRIILSCQSPTSEQDLLKICAATVITEQGLYSSCQSPQMIRCAKKLCSHGRRISRLLTISLVSWFHLSFLRFEHLSFFHWGQHLPFLSLGTTPAISFTGDNTCHSITGTTSVILFLVTEWKRNQHHLSVIFSGQWWKNYVSSSSLN